MTKKDYELIAKSLSRMVDSNTKGYRIEVIKRLAYELQEDNPRFDRTKFLEACGVV